MTVPLDMLTGAQDAVVQLLREQLPDDRRGMVRHSLGQNTAPPFHLVGDISSEDIGKGEQFEEIEVDLHTVYRGTDRGELLALMHEVHAATADASIEIGGALFRTRWVGAIASGAAADGVTYAGLTTIQIFAEPA